MKFYLYYLLPFKYVNELRFSYHIAGIRARVVKIGKCYHILSEIWVETQFKFKKYGHKNCQHFDYKLFEKIKIFLKFVLTPF